MGKLRLEDVVNHKEALAQARCGPFGQMAVHDLYKSVTFVAAENKSYYTFNFNLNCPWETKLKIKPKFTSLFRYEIMVKAPSELRIIGSRPIYLKSSPLETAVACRVWRACFFLDAFVYPFLRGELVDIADEIRGHLQGNLLVARFGDQRHLPFYELLGL